MQKTLGGGFAVGDVISHGIANDQANYGGENTQPNGTQENGPIMDHASQISQGEGTGHAV